MPAIWKYHLPFKEVSEVSMKKGAKVIRVGDANNSGSLWIWAIVDPNAEDEIRTFHLFKTGAEMPEDILDYTYLGCGAIFIQMELMMYIFEKQRK